MALVPPLLNNCSFVNNTQNCTIIVSNGTSSNRTTLTVLTSPGFLKIEQIVLMCFMFVCIGILYSCSNTVAIYSLIKSIQLHNPASKLLDPKEVKQGTVKCVNLETKRSAKVAEQAQTLCASLDYSHLGFFVNPNSDSPKFCVSMKENVIQTTLAKFKPRSEETVRDVIRAAKTVSDASTAQQLQLFLDIYEAQKYGPLDCSNQEYERILALCNIFPLRTDHYGSVQETK